MPRTLVAVLGFSHVDFNMALLWVKWANFLSHCSNPLEDNPKVVLFGTQRITDDQWKQLSDAAEKAHIMFIKGVAPDEDESGYPRSASHLFIRALEFCNEFYGGHAILWIETDCIPVQANWFRLVQGEYQRTDKPFMGVYVESVVPHMTGCGVYPPDWKVQAPKLATVVTAPDETRLWGAGKGQPWDTWAGADITPKMHRSRTIQQIWRPGTFTSGNLSRINPETALFHQCKNGSLIAALCHVHYPEFKEMQPPKDSAYMMLTSRPELVVLDTIIKFTPCARGPGGGLFCVFKPSSAMEEALICSVSAKHGVLRIDEQEYQNLIGQSKRLAV